MLRILILTLVASFIATPAAAAMSSYSVDKDKSFIKFVAIQNDAPIQGRFTDFSADIKFDHDNLNDGNIAVEVNTGSIEVANDDVQANVKLPEWLGVKEFPKAVFTAKKLNRMPNSENYYGEGELTIRGKKVPVVLNFQFERYEPTFAIARGYITLRRSDYDIGQGEWAKFDVLKNEVRVEFRIFAEKK